MQTRQTTSESEAPSGTWRSPNQEKRDSAAQARAELQRRRRGRSGSDFAKSLSTGLGYFSIGLGLAQIIAPRRVARAIGIGESPASCAAMRMFGLRELTSGIGILSQRRPSGWVWSRVVGDVMDLAALGSRIPRAGADRAKLSVATGAVVGVAALDLYAAWRLSDGVGASRGVQVTKSVTINRSQADVYERWHNFENLPSFMSHLESVQRIDDKRSHWRAKGPAGVAVEWDAEIVEDRPNERISWRSVEGSDVNNSGTVRFTRAPGGRGTEVHVELMYAPPGGKVTGTLSKLFGKEPEQQVEGDLRRFKQVMETGDIMHSDASIHRWMHPARPDETTSTTAGAKGGLR